MRAVWVNMRFSFIIFTCIACITATTATTALGAESQDDSFQRKLARSEAAAQLRAARIRSQLNLTRNDARVPYKGNYVSPFVRRVERQKAADAERHDQVMKRARDKKQSRADSMRPHELLDNSEIDLGRPKHLGSSRSRR